MIPFDCTLCSLHENRENVVQSRGNYTKPVFVVAESPGEEEDYSALTLVGDSGIMFEQCLKSVGIASQDLYLGNICRCRPVDNATPSKAQQNTCYPYLLEEIRKKKPQIILTLGNTPTKFLLNDSKAAITQVRGKLFKVNLPIIEGRKKRYTEESYLLLPTFHPNALLRNESTEHGSMKYHVWQDMILLRRLLEGEPPQIYKKLP